MRSLGITPIDRFISSATAALLISNINPALSGGFSMPVTDNSRSAVIFSPNSPNAHASSEADVTVSGAGVNYTSSTFASGDTNAAGNAPASNVNSSHITNESAQGDVEYLQNSDSKSTEFTKGGNSIGKTRSNTHTTIMVNGEPVIVSDEMAAAVSRITQFGSSAAAIANSNVEAAGGAYSVNQVNTSKGSR